MRVRSFELRLIGAALTVLWTIAAGLVLLGYRPGGPIDLVVGLAAGPPALIAAAALVWPPAARGDRSFAATVWLGLIVGLLLVPSIAGVIGQLAARGAQTLLPSLEAAYPWLLALIGTSLFAGLGIARRFLGGSASRRRRLMAGVVFSLVATLAAGSTFAGVAIANELALRDRPALSSRFGPTDPDMVPPACNAPMSAGRTAHVDLALTGDVDRRPIGSVQVSGSRSGTDVRWTAVVATDIALGRFGVARVADQGWQLTPRGAWTTANPELLDDETLDLRAVATALTDGYRATAEDRGIEFVQGARARHCRIAIDGPTFRLAFPQVTWLVGRADLHRWRGELDFWVFTDNEIGQVIASINGDAVDMVDTGLQATVRTTLTATDRDVPLTVSPPA
jgi:hypothetical protein